MIPNSCISLCYLKDNTAQNSDLNYSMHIVEVSQKGKNKYSILNMVYVESEKNDIDELVCREESEAEVGMDLWAVGREGGDEWRAASTDTLSR